MKYLIFSDLHGAYAPAKLMIQKFIDLKCDKILFLGDILYHGPRNDLPESYNPKKVYALLNEYKDKIVWIKGNCDAEIDEMVLEFKVNNSYDFEYNNKRIHLEHGHHLDSYSGNADIIMSGHTHIALLENKGNTLFVNPGSVAIPKNNTPASYMVLEDNTLTLYDLEDNVLLSQKI